MTLKSNLKNKWLLSSALVVVVGLIAGVILAQNTPQTTPLSRHILQIFSQVGMIKERVPEKLYSYDCYLTLNLREKNKDKIVCQNLLDTIIKMEFSIVDLDLSPIGRNKNVFIFTNTNYNEKLFNVLSSLKTTEDMIISKLGESISTNLFHKNQTGSLTCAKKRGETTCHISQ